MAHRALAVHRSHRSAPFRSHGRFPTWIEVGIDIWESVHDWHVRNQLPMTVNREGPGRITIAFFYSTLIGRADMEAGYIGLPFDER